jgi:hypothetical protein
VIYFLQPLDGGPVKIGHSADVDARRRQLESHYGRPLALLATMEGGREEEAVIHHQFRQHRLGRTEQFRPVPELLAFIGRPLLVDPNPEAVEPIEASIREIRLLVSNAFADWLNRVARFDRTSAAALIDRAVTRYAREIGFSEEPPKR